MLVRKAGLGLQGYMSEIALALQRRAGVEPPGVPVH